jgi:adenine-specific DNA-methyltransferase
MTDIVPKLNPKTDGSSMDVVQSLVDQLRPLVPEAFTEGKIDFDVLRELLGDDVEERQERYSFTWHGKSRARRIAQTPSTGTLRPCPEESVNWDTTKNIFIEGDNLEVLKLLQKSYHKKVKMIYIDPPYNTGNEFIYPDKFQDNLDTYLKYTGQVGGDGLKISANSETGGRYHTNWLNMMYPRLKLARNLLRDDGVIFISIDDHECTRLRCLCDEVFGEENFVATVIWHKVYVPKNSAKHFSEDHDYIFVYARSAVTWAPKLLPRTDAQDTKYKNLDNDPRGRWRAGPLAARNYYSRGEYSITCPSGRVIPGPPSGSYWRYSEDKFRELDRDNRIYWGADGDNSPATKLYLNEVRDGRIPQTIWSYDEVGHTQESKKELLSRIQFASSASVFDTPKPTRLIKRMVQIGTEKNCEDIVLDFFAGSASTGDAVMQINKADESNRRYILVQLPERTNQDDYHTIAEVGKARLRAAATVVSKDAQSVDCGFRVFKLDSSNLLTWAPDSKNLEYSLTDIISNIRPDRDEYDLLYELLLKFGLDLNSTIDVRDVSGTDVFVLGAGALVVCLAAEIDHATIVGIADLKGVQTSNLMRVVFKDSSFKDDVAKTNAIQILRQRGIEDVKTI